MKTIHGRMWVIKIASLALFGLIVVACGPKELANSDLGIRNGIHLEVGDQNTAPGLVFIGNCSATLVSTNTLITAAHCTSEGAQVCVRSGAWSGTCSSNTYIPSNYPTNRFDRNGNRIYNYAVDVAVVVFEGTPFKNFFNVGTRKPKERDPVVMVGYSSMRNDEPGRGSKRWGRNYISSFDRSELDSITSYDGGSVDRVAVDKGDSGGTMLNNRCELIGVTSRNCGDRGSCSIHTNITQRNNQKWLLDQIKEKNAQICGLPGTNNTYCPASGMATPDSNAKEESDGTAGFPCAPARTSAPGPQNATGFKVGLFAANNAFRMQVSHPGSGYTIAACANISDPTQCTTGLQNRYFQGARLRTVGSRSIYQIQRNFSQNDFRATWTLVARDPSGNIVTTRKFRISQ